MKSSSNNLKGLTLVELLIVLGLIAIMAGILVTVINPAKQTARSRDAVLRNTIGGIAQSIESFYNLKGHYPLSTESIELAKFISPGFTLAVASGTITFKNPNIFVGGVANTAITYYPAAGGAGFPCLEGVTNENPTTTRIGWAPGYAIKNITATCSGATGYAQLKT